MPYYVKKGGETLKTKEFYGLDVDRIFKTVVLEGNDYEFLNCL